MGDGEEQRAEDGNFSFRLNLLLPSSGCDVTGHKGITNIDYDNIKLG
jgi:hypothetical protein